ncbi:hypothetical protein D6745_01010 [Candidatus Woesearchaeota archaeon]|nr:MAG: hypothetical protein D6745_01010 [Candidatus Woesearchaeota archaeon]
MFTISFPLCGEAYLEPLNRKQGITSYLKSFRKKGTASLIVIVLDGKGAVRAGLKNLHIA